MIYGFIETTSGEIYYWEFTPEQSYDYPDWEKFIREDFIAKEQPLHWYSDVNDWVNSENTSIPADEVRRMWSEEFEK